VPSRGGRWRVRLGSGLQEGARAAAARRPADERLLWGADRQARVS
jgi:hypothetical protein